MAKKIKRPWIQPGADYIDPVEVDLNNLPVPKPVYTFESENTPRLPDNTYPDLNYTKINNKRMRNTGAPLFDEEDVMAAEQPLMQKIGRGLLSRGLSVGPKSMQHFGHIGGAIEYGVDYLFEGEEADPSVIWDNAVVNKMNELDQGLRDNLKIYKSFYGRNGNLLQQMGDAGFWTDDVFDSLAFLASAFVVGGATGSLAKSLAFSKAFMQTAEGARKAKQLQTYSATLFNTIGESGYEAKDFNDTQRDARAFQKYGRPFQELTEQNQKDIRLEVAEGAKNVYRGNVGVLLVPNYIQSRFMFGSAGKAAKTLRRNVRSGKIKSSDVNIFARAGRDMGVGMASEGLWEEGMQNALQTYNERFENHNQEFDDYAIGVANEWVDNFETTEGQKNMVLGAMIGGLFGGFGSVRESRNYIKSIAQEEQDFEHLKKTLSVNDQWIQEYITNPYKKFKITKTVEENGETREEEIESYFNEDGNVEFDMDKVNRMFLFSLNDKTLFDEAMAAAIKGDDIHLDMVNSDALARRFYRYATNENITDLEEAAQLLLERELQLPEELEKEGYTRQYTKSDLDPIIRAFEEAENELMSKDDFTEEQNKSGMFKSVLRKTLFIEKVRRNFFEELSSRENITEEQREQIDRLIEDSLKTERQIKDPKMREKLYKEFNQEIDTYNDAVSKMAQINQDGSIKNREDYLRAVYDIQEFRELNGTQNPFSSKYIYEYFEGLAENMAGFGPAVKANEFGTRYNHYYDLGRHGSRKTQINKGIADAKKGKTLISNIINNAISVFSEGGIVTDDMVERIERVVDQRSESIDRLLTEKARREQALEDNSPTVEIYDPLPQEIENPEHDPQAYARDQAWLENYQARQADLQNARENLNNLKEIAKGTDKNLPRDSRRSYRVFQRRFADKPVELARDLVRMFKSNNTFDDLDYVDQTISQLQDRKTVYETPGRKRMLRTNEFKGYMESLDQAIEDLKGIRKTVEKNSLNRRTQDRRSVSNYGKSLFSAIGISVDKTGGTFEITNQTLYDLIEGIVGKEFLDNVMNMARRARKEGVDYSFDAIFVEKILYEVKKSKAGRKKLLGYLESERPGLFREFNDIANSIDVIKNDKTSSFMVALMSYQANPFKTLDHLIREIANKEAGEITEASVIDKFLRDKDVYDLIAQVEQGVDLKYKSISNEDLLRLLKAHISVVSNVALRDRVESSANITDIVARESHLIRGKDQKAPSGQQMISLREIIFNVNRPVKNKGKKYSLWFYVKGLAGTGKTVVVSSRLPQLLGYKDENITALSTHKRALAVLQKSLKGVENTKLATDLTVEDLLREENRLVIIDEIARLEQHEMDALAEKVVEANKIIEEQNKTREKEDQRDNIFVIILGDPTQVTSKDQTYAAVNSLTGAIPNIKEIYPLTSVFRTGNSSIIRIQNLFQDFPGKIQSLKAVATDKLGKPADGVHTSKRQEDLVNQITAHSKANDRSRVVVVSSPAQLKYYKDKLSALGVEVMYYYDVAGLEFDEVYSDIDPNDFKLEKKFNEAMYTTVSRSVQYAFIRSYRKEGDWSFIVDEIEVENFEKRDKEIMADYTDRLAFEAEVLGDEMEGVDFASPQQFDLKESEEKKIAEEQTSEEPADREPHSTDNTESSSAQWGTEDQVRDGEVHSLAAPSYAPIKSKKREGAALVREGNKVKYIKAKKEGSTDWEIQVVGEMTNKDGTSLSEPQWAVIGVMTQDEREKTAFGRRINKMLESVDKREFAGLSRGNEGKLVGSEKAVLVEGTVKKAQPLSYKYNRDKLQRSGPGLLNSLMTRMERVFKGEKLSYSVKIFTKTDNTDLSPGVPYLLIHREGKEDQFISLSGRYLKKGDKFPVAIKKYRDAMQALVNAGVEEQNIGRLLKRMKRNYQVVNDEIVKRKDKPYGLKENAQEDPNYGIQKLNKEQFEVLERQAAVMIPLYYGIGQSPVEVASEQAMWEYLGEGKRKDKDVKYEFKKHKKADGGYILMRDAKNVDISEYVTQTDLVAGKGEAQIALNILAKANAAKADPSDANHKPWIIRTQNTLYKDGKRSSNYIATSKSLAADETTYGEYYKHLLSLFDKVTDYARSQGIETPKLNGGKYRVTNRSISSEENVNALEQKLLEFKNIGIDVEGIDTREFARLRELHQRTPITIEQLDDLLTFDESGSHSNMYYALDIDFINNRGEELFNHINELDSVLGTKLEEINQTKIDVQIDEAYVPKVPYEKKEGVVKKAIKKATGKLSEEQQRLLEEAKRRANKRGRRMTGDMAELGRPLTFAEAREMMAKYVPETTKAGEDVLRFIDRLLLDKMAGKDSWGLYQDELIHVYSKDGRTFENPIRHEAFHKIFWEGLTEVERLNVVNAFKQQYPQYKNKTFDEIEELIAETWHRNEVNPVTGLNKVLMDFFNWLSRVLGIMNRNTKNLDRFFATMESGYYRNSRNDVYGIKRPMKAILSMFNTESYHVALDLYTGAKDLIQSKVYDYIANGRPNPAVEGSPNFPLTRTELFDVVKKEIKAERDRIADDVAAHETGERVLPEDVYFYFKNDLNYHNAAFNHFGQIWNTIYENWEVNDALELQVDDTLSVEDYMEELEELESVNLRAHILDSDQWNQESKLSALVKDFLSNILVNDNQYMKWREGYIRMLQLLDGVRIDDEKSFMAQLDNKVKQMGDHPRIKIVADHFKTLYNKVDKELNNEGIALDPTIKFSNEDVFIYGSRDIEKEVNGPVRARILGHDVITRNKGEATRIFIERIVKKTGLNQQDIIDHFFYLQNKDQFKGILNLLNNQQEKDFFIAETKWKSGGSHTITYIPGSYYGIHTSVLSDIQDRVREIASNKKELEEFVTKWLKPVYTANKTNKHQFVQQFLSKIGMPNEAKIMPSIGSEKLYNDIKGFFDRALQEYGEKQEIVNEGGEVIDEINKDMSFFVEYDKSTLSFLAKVLSSSDQFIRATNIKTMDGKKRYLWSPSSFMSDTLNYLRDTYLSKKAVGVSLPLHLQNEFYSFNPFVNKRRRIYRVITNDGLRKIGYDENAKYALYKNEKKQDYLTRSFGAGFMDRIRRGNAENKRYFQWFYPNERAQAIAAEVKLLNGEQTREAVVDMIRQVNHLAKEQGSEHPGRDKFINMRLIQEALKDRTKSIWDKPLTEKEISKVADQVNELLSREADRFADNLIKNRVNIDRDISRFKGLQSFFKDWEGYDITKLHNAVSDSKNILRSRGEKSEYLITKEMILPFVDLYIRNDYVNSYFINQAVLGDMNQYINEEDILRRYSLASAPGARGTVHSKIGIKEKARILIMGDSTKTLKDIEAKLDDLLKTEEEKKKLPLLKAKFEKNFDSSDGQGFMLPERFEDLKYGGFTGDFSIHKVLKPVIYSINENNRVHGIKFSSIVLTDELVGEFPSLGYLRDNMRSMEYDEAVFASGVKMGMPDQVATYPAVMQKGQKPQDNMGVTIYNKDYRIQLDPISKIESTVTQPSQLIYLMNVLNDNQSFARDTYEKLAQIARLEGNKLMNRLNDPTQFRETVLSMLTGKGSELAYDAMKGGVSKDFPILTDKIITQIASGLNQRIAKIPFSGTKLVLQTEAGVRKYGDIIEDGPQNKLKYYREEDTGRLVTEMILPRGLLPAEYEKRIENAIAEGKKADNYFDTPDLLGFRIPSSDIHSGVVVKVVGFYSTPNVNVVIAPDLLVALHGSDFDVDSLFIIKRYLYPDGKPIGYKKVNGKYVYDEKAKFNDSKDTVKHLKNGILENMITMLAAPHNVTEMLAPIPLNKIKAERDYIRKATGQTSQLDLSNANDKLRAHDIIFGAAAATGIFGNNGKVLSYIMNAGSDNKAPVLIDEDRKIKIGNKTYDRITLVDDSGLDNFIQDAISIINKLGLPGISINNKDELIQLESKNYKNTTALINDFVNKIENTTKQNLQVMFYNKDGQREIIDYSNYSGDNLFTSNDGFINVAIDNIREMALHVLNITQNTIDAFNGMRAIGIPLRVVNNFMQQPAILDISNHYDRNLSTVIYSVKKDILEKLNVEDIDIAEVKIDKESLITNMGKEVRSISDMPQAFDENGKRNTKAYNALLYQLKVLEIFQKGHDIGSQLSKLAKWLKIARVIPSNKFDIDNTITEGESIFGKIQEDGQLPGFESKGFPFDIKNFFLNNVHILEILNQLKTLKTFVENNFKKYNPYFMGHVDRIYAMMDKKTGINDEGRKLIQDELITYLMSNEFYSGKYGLDNDLIYEYVKDGEIKTLTGPKAFNQIFIEKVRAVKGFIANQTDENGQKIDNKFVSHLNSFFNPHSKTWQLRFDGGSNLDAEEYLSHRAAFLDLNQYDVTWNKKTKQVEVTYHSEPRPYNEYTGFQNEFVSFGIMNWGLKFGATNYSVILPSDMYTEVDKEFNKILDQYIGKIGKKMWELVEDHFALQFVTNYGDIMQESFFTHGRAEPTGKYINSQGKERNFYGGKTDSYFFDRRYMNPEEKEMKRFIIAKIGKTKQVFVRMNESNAKEVHYQRISNLSPFPTYNFSDQVMRDGYDIKDHFGVDPKIGEPVYNYQTSDLKLKTFKYNGSDLKAGDIISLTAYHDVARTDKVYKRISKIDDGDVYLKDVSEEEINKIKTPKLSEAIIEKANLSGKFKQIIKRNYSLFNNTEELMDYIIVNTTNQAAKKTLIALKEVFVRQDVRISFASLPGRDYGRYRYDGSIEIDIDKIIDEKGLKSPRQIDRAIVHEMGHGIIDIAYHTNPKFKGQVDSVIHKHFDKYSDGKLRPKSRQKTEILQRILNQNGYNVDVEDLYGLTNEREFVTELLSNASFSQAMDEFMDTSGKSLFRQFIDAVLEFFGFKQKETLQDYFIELLQDQEYTPNMIKIGQAKYTDSTGRVWELEDSKLVETEEKTEVEEKSDLRKAVKDLAAKIKSMADKLYLPLKEDGTEENHYIHKETADRYIRITDKHSGSITYFKNKKIDPNISFGQNMADIWWEGVDHEHKMQTDEGNMENYDEFRQRMDDQMKYGGLKGNIMHMLLLKTANKRFNLGLDNAEIDKRINELEASGDGLVSAENYQWIEEPGVLENIFHNAGIHILDKDTPEIIRDVEYLPEVSVFSELLGWAGTIDALIGHSDNTWSLVDYKTGRNFGKHISSQKLKYGEQEVYITENQRELAKLQIMKYAFMLKLNNPDMRFRDLMVLWVPDRWLAERQDPERHVEVRSYLRMLEQFFSDKEALKAAGLDPNIKQKILEKSPKIFDPGEYTSKANLSIEKQLIDSEIDPEEVYKQKVTELTILLNKFKQQRRVNIDELDNKTKDRIAALYEDIQLMKADPSLQVDVFPGQEIGLFTAWLGNYNDVNMDVFQTWVKLRNERTNTYKQQHERDLKEFEKKLYPIYDRYMKGKIRIRRGGLDRFAMVNYPELFNFAFKEFEDGGRMKERLLIETDPEWNNLEKDEQELLTYFNDMMEKWFTKDGYFTQKAAEINGEDYSWMDLHNLGKSPDRAMKYYRGWFPKVMKTQEEVNYEQGAAILGQEMGRGDIKGANILGKFSKTSINERIKRTLTWYQEDVFEGYGDVKMAIPIKFLDNFKIVNNREYSHSLMKMFDEFNKSSLNKQYMDSVYTAGEALKVYLQGKRYGSGQPMFENTIGFLERKLIHDIQNRTLKMKWSGKPIELGKRKISIDKIIEMMQNWTSMTVMWLRPLQGGGNGLHAKMLTYRESLKGSIASKFLHIQGDAIDFKVEDNVFADGIYFGSFLRDSMIGDLRKNKAWLLARKLDYMPDNYDYATNRRFLLSMRNRIMNQSSMYMFHSKPEEYVSLTTMIAQLHYLKNPVDGKSLWDSYEVQTDENGISDVVWIGGLRGYERVGKGSATRDQEIRELTTHEIEKLKRVHERMQGGYRKEEAATLELYVLGKSMIQFKKYFPRLLMNAMAGKREEVSLGAYKKLYEQKIDPETGKTLDVYEWTRRLNEGRWRTLTNAFLNFTRIQRDEAYKWDTMTSEQKQNIVDAMLTIGIWALSYGLYLTFFDDEDDDDTFKKWWRNYLILNLSQQYNPYELLHTLETTMRPVSFARAWKLTEATRNMLFATANLAMGNDDAALTTKGQLRGWNEMMRSIPYLASWHDWAIKMQHGSFTEEWWSQTWAHKWR